MDRRAAATLIVYAAVLATLLFVPTTDDEAVGGVLFATLLLAHVVLGIGVARWWALVVPLAFLAVLVETSGDVLEAAYGLLFGWPVAMMLTAIGVALGRRAGSTVTPVLAVLLACTLAGPAYAAVVWLDRGPPLPTDAQARLPRTFPLTSLCAPGGLDDRMRARAEGLIEELGRHPDATVSVTEYYAHYDEEVEMTVRDLAERRLSELEDKGARCAPELQERLRAAIDAS